METGAWLFPLESEEGKVNYCRYQWDLSWDSEPPGEGNSREHNMRQAPVRLCCCIPDRGLLLSALCFWKCSIQQRAPTTLEVMSQIWKRFCFDLYINVKNTLQCGRSRLVSLVVSIGPRGDVPQWPLFLWHRYQQVYMPILLSFLLRSTVSMATKAMNPIRMLTAVFEACLGETPKD